MSQQITIPGPGDVLAERYRIIDELGRGSYGVVFKALELSSDRLVAIKTLLPQSVLDSEVINRFEREAQLVSRLDHPNVIGLHDYGQRDNLFYMVMEFIEGRSLDDLLKNEAPCPPDKVQDLLIQCMNALAHAHERGIVHRDLKPANILLQPSADGKESVKVLDFGIAKALRDENQDMKTLTLAGHVLGTPHYMSPEQIAGDEVDHRADVYAMGVITYELLVGEHPFEGTSTAAVMVAHLRDDPPALPDHLERSKWGVIVREAMKKQPEDRLADAQSFLRLLEGNHDLIDADESNEVTALFSQSSMTETDEVDQGATQEMTPLKHLYHPSQVSPPEQADATTQWKRSTLPIEPDFGAQPLYGSSHPSMQTHMQASAPQRVSPSFLEVADPAQTERALSTTREGGGQKRLLVVLVILFASLFAAMAAYAFFWSPQPPDEALTPPVQDSGMGVVQDDMGEDLFVEGVRDAGVARQDDMSVEVDSAAGERDEPDLDAEEPDDIAQTTTKKQSPSTVSLEITSDPRGARVLMDNRAIGTTPLTHRLKQSDKTVSISVSETGFKKKTQSIQPNKSHSIHIVLDAEFMMELSP